jgi:hypothetical protein
MEQTVGSITRSVRSESGRRRSLVVVSACLNQSPLGISHSLIHAHALCSYWCGLELCGIGSGICGRIVTVASGIPSSYQIGLEKPLTLTWSALHASFGPAVITVPKDSEFVLAARETRKCPSTECIQRWGSTHRFCARGFKNPRRKGLIDGFLAPRQRFSSGHGVSLS